MSTYLYAAFAPVHTVKDLAFLAEPVLSQSRCGTPLPQQLLRSLLSDRGPWLPLEASNTLSRVPVSGWSVTCLVS